MSWDIQKLMEHEHVNERRARRLIKEFGSYDEVMAASYRELLETHYIGEKTARSVYRASRREEQPSLL